MSVEGPANPVDARIQELIGSSRIFLFMKGSKNFPQCGFSGAVVGLLDELGVDFETCDVLKDSEIRQGIKTFSDWPTIPQLYIDQEFVGGSDIVRQMSASGELQKMLGVEVVEVQAGVAIVTIACTGGKTIVVVVIEIVEGIQIIAVVIAGGKAVAILIGNLQQRIGVVTVSFAGRISIPVDIIQIQGSIGIVTVLGTGAVAVVVGIDDGEVRIVVIAITVTGVDSIPIDICGL